MCKYLLVSTSTAYKAILPGSANRLAGSFVNDTAHCFVVARNAIFYKLPQWEIVQNCLFSKMLLAVFIKIGTTRLIAEGNLQSLYRAV